MCIQSSATTRNSVLAEYKSKLQSFESQIARLNSRKFWILFLALKFFVLWAALILWISGTLLLFLQFLPILLLAVGCAFVLYNCAQRKSICLAHLVTYYERAIDRLEDNWHGNGNTGLDYTRDNHLYQTDLDILGHGSLFEILATTRTEAGAVRLADFLLSPTTLHEAEARQQAVKELQNATTLREEIAQLGKFQFQNCDQKNLRQWLNLPHLSAPKIIPILLFLTGTLTLALSFSGAIALIPWFKLALYLIPLFATQALIALTLMSSVRPLIFVLRTLSNDIAILRQGMALISRQSFHSTKLRQIIARINHHEAHRSIRKLNWLIYAIALREDAILYGFALWFAVGTQLVLAIERWRNKNQSLFEEWLDAWAEFEAVNALATYAYEHPENTFPDLVDGSSCFEAESLSHPLIPHQRAIGNSITLNSSTACLIISGSNMAGKSTLLRAIGLNVLLAAAGTSICATSARTTLFRICASISIADSLLDGKSKFLAEVERISQTLHLAAKGNPVLFLIDEILSGTNSNDRHIAAHAVLRSLTQNHAIGALSTHDLALIEIASDPDLRVLNMHMQSDDPDQPLAFDYLLKSGISTQSNALAIVRMMGIAM